MTFYDARDRLLWHSGRLSTETDEISFSQLLRPFEGMNVSVVEDCSVTFLKCFRLFNVDPMDKTIVVAAWDMIHRARHWIREDSPLVRDELMKQIDRAYLESRLHGFERFCIRAIDGEAFALASNALVQSLIKYPPSDVERYAFLLEECSNLSELDDCDRDDVQHDLRLLFKR